MTFKSALSNFRYVAGGLAIGLFAAFVSTQSADAAGDPDKAAYYPKHQHWHFTGIFGSFDKNAVQRGYKVYKEVCATCHAMEYVAFRNLGQKGGPFHLDRCPEELGLPDNVDCSNPNDNPLVKAIAAEFMVMDGPDDFGDMFERPGEPKDRFPAPYANEQQARAVNNGAYPVDLSLITKARKKGPDYVYSLLTGYSEAPADVEVPPGQYYNKYFEGRLLSMAPPLIDEIVLYDDGSPETVEQYTKDLVEFLHWAAEPKLEVRKRLGFMVLTYLIIFTGILYWSYRQIWRNVDH